MDNSRRPFDRSREPGLKKPRLAEETGPGPIGRAFPQRAVVGAAAAGTRFRSSDSDSGDLRGSGGGYEPQPLPAQQLHEELLSQYKRALAELTFNSKPIITSLTIIAGENLQAAKAIAAVVCANILEVPSDQKLPSLYLLDSIVKNIGRDYIKYFAPRLPEIFCKAYRQVDPSVHSSMRHLFGTWKGVFPPQTLQIIEKELAFASMVNGSSSGTARTDTQSQRQPHSIHVNPKYLERQQLQQSSRSKVMVNKMTGAISNSEVDTERPERVTTLSSGRPWVDPSVKMRNIQQTFREPLSEAFPEKGAAYGEYEYASVFPRTSSIASGRTSGRISAQGHDRPLYAVGDIVPEAVSSQRNGFNVKPGFPNFLASKSSSIDGHPLTTKSAANKSNSLLSSSWKNSEEEEFMWDTHSRRLDHDIPSNVSAKRDSWNPDGSENLDILDLGSLSNEQKDQTASGTRTESEWLLSGLHKKDRLTHSGNSTITSVHSEGYSGALGGLPMTSASLVKASTRQQVGSSHMHLSGSAMLANVAGSSETLGRQHFLSRDVSSPGQSPIRQRSPSPSFQTRDPRKQLQYLVEREYPQVPRPDAKPSQNSARLNAGPNKHYQFSRPLQLETLEPEPSGHNEKLLVPGKPDSRPAMEAEKVSDYSVSPAVETTEQLNASSLLAAVMKSGILSNSIGPSTVSGRESVKGGKLPSRSGSLTAVSFTSTGTKVESNALLDSGSHDSKLNTMNKSGDKVEQPPLVAGSPSSSEIGESKATNPLSNLLSSLVAKGLISASKTESQSSVPHQLPDQIQNKSPDNSASSSPPVSSVPFSSETTSSAVDEVLLREPAATSLAGSVDCNKKEVDNLIGLEFKPDIVREFHPSVIRSLSDDLPHQCNLCGIRLKLHELLERHLKWHTMKSPEQSALGCLSRRWYVRSGDWVSGNVGDSGVESCSVSDEPEESTEQSKVSVRADENQCACILCGELFEDYFDQERNEWMFKAAVYLTIKLKDGELGTTDEGAASGPIVHEHCLSDGSLHDLGVAGVAELVV